MRQFTTSNIWSKGMMPASFFKEQVFNMCEKISDACVWNEVIVRFHEKYNGESLKHNDVEKIRPITKRIFAETGELDEYDENLLDNVTVLAIEGTNISSSTSDILHNLYPIKFDWKSWDLDKLTAYYQIILDGFKELKIILGEDLNHLLIRNGIMQMISNMKKIHETKYAGSKKLSDHIILLYPLGLVDGKVCYNTDPEKGYLFWGIERLSQEKYGRNQICSTAYSYSNLALEILVESFFDSGEYQYENENVTLTEENDDQVTIAEDVLNHYDNSLSYIDISRETFPFEKNTKKALDRIDKTFDVIKENTKKLWNIHIQEEVSNNKKDAIVMLYLLHKYSHFRICEGKNFSTKNIFHILTLPSYENSLTGFLEKSTRNSEILFSLKSDLLRYILEDEECKKRIFRIGELISRVYLDFNARIETIKDALLIKGLRASSFHDVDNIISMALSDKEDILKYIQVEFHDMYKGTVSFPREANLLVFIYLKICESEYEGILRDMELLYQNMGNWLINLTDSSTKLLLNRQSEIESEATDFSKDFDFEDYLKSHSRMIAEITDPNDVEKAAKEIRRYTARCFNIWQAVLDWYPFSDWGKKNNAYADFGTMVAIVQLERQLRKGNISITYLSAYRGDRGKKVTVRFREELPEDKIAVEIIMNLLFFQIFSNFGLHQSIQVALRIMRMYIAQYKGILGSNSITELDKRRQEYAQDANLPQENATYLNICRAKNAANELYQEEVEAPKH